MLIMTLIKMLIVFSYPECAIQKQFTKQDLSNDMNLTIIYILDAHLLTEEQSQCDVVNYAGHCKHCKW